jgi:TP901 family phage tail tape measure protein
VEIGARMSGLEKGLARAEARLRAFGARTQALGRGMATAAAAVGAPLLLSARAAGSFEEQMAAVRAVSEPTADEFARMRDLAAKLGRTTSFTAKEAASGMFELAKAGFDTTQILQTTPGVLNLARAAGLDLGRAAEIAAAQLRSFGLPASESSRVMDVLAATATGAATDVELIGESMKYIAPIANEAGESIEAVAAGVGILANNGIKGSQAGTALTRAYKNLSKSAVQNRLAEMGVDATTAAGDLRPLQDILIDLQGAVSDMGSAGRLDTFETLFGRGSAAALKLARSGDKFANFRQRLEASEGAAQRIADVMEDTMFGAFRRTMSAVEGLQIAIGDHLKPELEALAERVQAYVARATTWVEANKQAVVWIAKAAAAAAAMGTTLIAVGAAAKAAAFALGAARGLAGAARGAIAVVRALNAAMATTAAMNWRQAILSLGGAMKARLAAGALAAKGGVLRLVAALRGLTAAGLISGVSTALRTMVASMAVALGPVGAFAIAIAAVGAAAYKAWRYLEDSRYIAKVEEDTRQTTERIKELNREILKTQKLAGYGIDFTSEAARQDVENLVDEWVRAGKTSDEIREKLEALARASETWTTAEYTPGSGYSREVFEGQKNEYSKMNQAYQDFLANDLAALEAHNRAARRERARAASPAAQPPGARAPTDPLGPDLSFGGDGVPRMADFRRMMDQAEAEFEASINASVSSAPSIPTPADISVPAPSPATGVGTAAVARAVAQGNATLAEIREILDERLRIGLA